MSVQGNIQTMYAQLLEMEEEVQRLMVGLEQTEEQAVQTQITLNRALVLVNQFLGLLRKLGLPEEYSDMFFAIQRFIMLVQQAIIVTQAFYATAGPVGWVILASGAAGIALTYGDTLAGYV